MMDAGFQGSLMAGENVYIWIYAWSQDGSLSTAKVLIIRNIN